MSKEMNLEYKSFTGSVKVCLVDDLLHGKLLGITDLVEDEVNGKTGLCGQEGHLPHPFVYIQKDEFKLNTRSEPLHKVKS